MASRFAKSKEGDKTHYSDAATNPSTKMSTNTWLNIWNLWAKERGYVKNIHEYNPQELDKILQQFYIEVRKENGDKYEPQCLNVMITALDRYLKNNGYQVSIVRDHEFAASKKILDGVAVELRRKGKGKLANPSRSLSLEDEQILWTHGEFGKTHHGLYHIHYGGISVCGIRGRSEHYNLQIEDLAVENDEKREFVIVYEIITENHWGGGGGGFTP